MENKDIYFDDATIKDIRTKLYEKHHSVSHEDIMESLMRRMGMDEQKPSTDTTTDDETIKIIPSKLTEYGYDDGYCGPTETPNQQYVNDVNKQIVKEVEKQYNIQQYHEKHNIPYPMSEVKRKQHKIKRKNLKN